ncbi:MAG: HXXEE domain-containing protein [Candidatus Methanofastidiosia archaeon]
MFDLLNELSFAQISWLSVFAYILHYAEEGPRLVEWFNKHYKPKFGSKTFHYTQKKLNLENAILFGFTLFMVILFNIFPENWILQAFILATGVGYIGNTFFHVIPTLRTGIYSPGVVTASMIFPLVFVIYIWKADQLRVLTLPTLVVAIIVGIIGLPIAVIITHKIILRNDK